MTTLFVSDLHLDAARPDKLELFARFAARAHNAQALYILGDLFEVWVGDDDDNPAYAKVIQTLRKLSNAGVAVYVAHGNRDFLFGKRFENASGATLLPDYAIIDLHGQRTLLTHGDLLCTRDTKYQKFRRVVRNPLVQFLFLAAPLPWRKRIAYKTQSGTRASMAQKHAAIMDVDMTTVSSVMTAHDTHLLIHGHTHRPDVHHFEIDGQACKRIVLGDWYEQDSVLIADADGQRSQRIGEFLASAA